jgi:MSHA biogenesis protein MshQ
MVLAASAAQAGSITLNAAMTVDNSFTAYISTDDSVDGTAFLSGGSWPTIDNGSFEFTAAGTYYLHVFAHDSGRPAMFIGNFSLSSTDAWFSNGTQNLLTDASTGDWTASITGFGGTDVGVVDLGANGAGPWGNFAPLGDARFMWATGDPSPLDAYFSTVITVVPAPASALGLIFGGFMAGRRRRIG